MSLLAKVIADAVRDEYSSSKSKGADEQSKSKDEKQPKEENKSERPSFNSSRLTHRVV